MPQNTYIRTTWVNDSDPPINAGNLNKIEQGIVDAHIHMATKDNPHGVTTEQIGAATEANLNAHINDNDNPHGVTTEQIGAATKANLNAHINNNDNPHGVTTEQIGAATEANLNAHIGDKDNPHSVTTEQIGAATEANLNAHIGNKANPHQVTHNQTNPESATVGADTQRVKHVSDKDFTNWEEHRGDKTNPHEVTHDQTNPEGVDLTDDDVERNKHISNDDGKRWNDHVNHPNPHSNHETPAGAQAKVNAHAERTDNPHNVTAVQIGAVDITVLTAHEENATLHVTPEQRAALDYSEYPPTGENPVVTTIELHNAMAGSTKSAVGTAAELSAIPPTQRRDRDMRLVEETGKIYRFDAEATEGDIPPDEGSGYWIAVASATQSHNNLSGMQGGDASLVQYYHLSHDEYIDVTTHHERLDNPHEVTAVQVGAVAAINGITAPGGHLSIWQQGEDLETTNDHEAGTILFVNNHNGRKDNPHEVTHDQVAPMPVEYGLDESRNKHLSNSDYTRWEDHLANKSNPHEVTAAQIGAIAAINGITAPGGHILIWQQGEDLETANDPEAGTILLVNNHNGRKDNPHEVTHDQVDPVPVEYGPDETRDKHLSNSDYTRWEDHRMSPVAHGSTPENMGGRIVQRDAEGRAKVSDPEDDDDIATKGYVDQSLSSFDGVPSGIITMWSGAIANIPSGWALCDGSNGTPDLRDRFIVGAGGSYNMGDTGGSPTVKLTVAQLPNHNHTASSDPTGGHSHTGITSLDRIGDQYVIGSIHTVAGKHYNAYNETIDNEESSWAGLTSINPDPLDTNHWHEFTTSPDGSHSHDITIGDTGGGEPHENRPPYYALAYIMKL